MNLYWVTTEDHDEDWFVVARNAKEAAAFHENAEGYDVGDATAEMIMEMPEGVTVQTGWPSDEVLLSCGADIVSDAPARVVRIGERTFCEGLMESLIRELDDDRFEAIGEGRPNETEKISGH
jgi:hypothetical protein